MQSFDFGAVCSECSHRLVDACDELVCPICGVVAEKTVTEEGSSRPLLAVDFTRQALGSYLGPHDPSPRERSSKGISGENSRFGYLKVMSDYLEREDTSVCACAKLAERVGEKLSLPRVVVPQTVSVIRKLLERDRGQERLPLAAVSAYALIAACKIEGITSASVKEILAVYSALGKRVKVSSIIRLSIDSPVKLVPRKPEEYISRVIAKLSLNLKLRDELEAKGVRPTAYFSALRETAGKILDSTEEGLTAGHNPCALAATAAYAAEVVLAGNESRGKRLTQRDLAECGDTAEYTVREQYRDIFSPALRVQG